MSRAGDREDLFESGWLNDCLHEARGIKKFRKMEADVCEDLVDFLRPELDSQLRQQALFSLLGMGFVQKNFPHHKYDTDYLDREIHPRKKEQALEEAKQLIQEKVLESVRDIGVEKKLWADIREIFSSDLITEMQTKMLKQKMIKIKKGKRGRTKIIELEDTTPLRSAFVEATLQDLLKNGGPQVEGYVLDELTNRVLILPPIFRHRLFDRLYLHQILPAEKKREIANYGDKIRQQLKKHDLRSVVDWEGRRHIDTSVIIAYERSPELKEEFGFDDDDDDADLDDKLIFFTRILCQAKLVDGTFSPTHIFWLIRAAKYFPPDLLNNDGHRISKEERALSMAYHFHRFSKVAIWSDSTVFELAQEAFYVLEKEEADLMMHLSEHLRENANGRTIDPTLFSHNVLSANESERKDLMQRFLKKKRISEQDIKVFCDIRLFIRKWLSECFVASLTSNGASLVWDFLFLHKFSHRQGVNVCLGLINLLKPLLRQANNFKLIQRTMMDGPKALLIRDLRRVLKHFSYEKATYGTIPEAPDVPGLEITPPSAREEKTSMEKRIKAMDMDYISVN